MELTGKTLGNYTIEAMLGEGGFALVYRARHVILESEHAVKVLRPELLATRHLRDRFLDEARVMARLRHHHIVRATDVIRAEGVAGIVMDFISGGSLEGHIAQASAPPAPAQVRAVLLPILDALQFAHDSGVIHRDIKPANILLEARPGGQVRPLLTDFGIAQVRGALERSRAQHTVAGLRMGSYGYMSPEQSRGADHVDPRSDLCSLAATAFALATLQRPVQGESEYDVMEATIHGDLSVPEALQAADPVLAAALQRALLPDPAARFSSCRELAEALQARPAAASPAPPPLPPRLRRATSAEVVEPVEPPPREGVVVRPRRPPQASDPGLVGMDLAAMAAGQAEGSVTLTYRPGQPQEQVLSLVGGRVTVGRATGNDVQVHGDDWVERYHCRLERDRDGVWRVRDSGTTHGTAVNGELVLEQPLRPGDRIEVGRTVLRFDAGT